MEHLNEETVLRIGGWDPMYTTVLAIAVHNDIAIALLDADSEINLDDFERDAAGHWQAGAASGSAVGGPGTQGRVAYTLGQADPGTSITVDYQGSAHSVVASSSGWWAFVAPFDPDRSNLLPIERRQ